MLYIYIYIVESNNKLCILSVFLSFFRVCCVCALNDVLGEVGKGISFLSRFPCKLKIQEFYEFFLKTNNTPSLKNGAEYHRETRLERIRLHVLFVAWI